MLYRVRKKSLPHFYFKKKITMNINFMAIEKNMVVIPKYTQKLCHEKPWMYKKKYRLDFATPSGQNFLLKFMLYLILIHCFWPQHIFLVYYLDSLSIFSLFFDRTVETKLSVNYIVRARGHFSSSCILFLNSKSDRKYFLQEKSAKYQIALHLIFFSK